MVDTSANTTDNIKQIDEAALKEYLNDKSTLVIDTREKSLFDKSFIVGSIGLPYGTPVFERFGARILQSYKNIVVIDTSANVQKVLGELSKNTDITIKGYFDGDSQNFSSVKLPTKSVEKTDPKDLPQILKSDQNALVLDVRTPPELETNGFVKDSINVPLGELAEKVSTVPKDRKIYVHCAGGVRAVTAYSFLIKENYGNVSALACSFDQIRDAGVEIVKK